MDITIEVNAVGHSMRIQHYLTARAYTPLLTASDLSEFSEILHNYR